MTNTETLVKNIIDSLCVSCSKRLLHFQLFTSTTASVTSKFNWITEYLNEKKKNEINSEPKGCGVCFGILEKLSKNEYLTELSNDINASGVQFEDFRISLTAPNSMTLREKYIGYLLDSIPIEEFSLRLYNPNSQGVKEQWKILTFHPLELIMKKPYNHTSLFDVKVKFSVDDSQVDSDNKLLATLSPPVIEGKPKRLSRKAREQKEVQEKGFTRTNVDKLLSETSLEKMKNFYTLPFERIICKTEIECVHDPIFLAGRYLKFSRTLSQTAWIIEGERRLSTSIEEIIGDILKKELSAQECVFTASGREDIDVKCLGLGRPFMMEIFQPKRTAFTREELNHYQKLINSASSEMAVRDLQYVTREQTKKIREGQQEKSKVYTALCYCYSSLDENDMKILNQLEKVTISQKTPIRVLHRRTVLTRERDISDIRAELVDQHHFRIRITTQAGAYVKEFVHGDLGRTDPSLCTILNKECDILELDVEAVNLDFPTIIDEIPNLES